MARFRAEGSHGTGAVQPGAHARNPARSQRDCGRQIEVNPYIAKTGTLAERPVSRKLLRSHGCSSSCHRPDALPTTLPRSKCAGATRGGANLVVNWWLDAGTRRDPSRSMLLPYYSSPSTLSAFASSFTTCSAPSTQSKKGQTCEGLSVRSP